MIPTQQKKSNEFVDAIKRDVEWLGFKWDTERYASDYFQQLYDWASRSSSKKERHM